MFMNFFTLLRTVFCTDLGFGSGSGLLIWIRQNIRIRIYLDPQHSKRGKNSVRLVRELSCLPQVELQGGARAAGRPQRPSTRLRQGGVRDTGTRVSTRQHTPHPAQG